MSQEEGSNTAEPNVTSPTVWIAFNLLLGAMKIRHSSVFFLGLCQNIHTDRKRLFHAQSSHHFWKVSTLKANLQELLHLVSIVGGKLRVPVALVITNVLSMIHTSKYIKNKSTSNNCDLSLPIKPGCNDCVNFISCYFV